MLRKVKSLLCFIVLSLLIFRLQIIIASSSTCPSGKECIVLSKCPQLLKLLSEQPINPNNLRLLQEATCDSVSEEPKVCCEKPKVVVHPNAKLLPNTTECGKSNPVESVDEKIAGGSDARLGTYPWMVLIGYSSGEGPKAQVLFACGGTLINSRYILTAGHCVSDLPPGFAPVVARVGEYNQTASMDCASSRVKVCAPPVQDIPIAEVVIHEDYNRHGKTENDIALLRLEKHAAFGPFVSPVCLPHGEKLQKVSSKPTVAGWGRTTADNPDNSNVLQHVSVPFQTMEKCNEFYASSLGDKVDDGRFCAGGDKGKDSCKGDSGGPLMMLLKAKSVNWALRFFQFGIVSLGPKDCDSSTHPALYTKISHFMPWILGNLRP